MIREQMESLDLTFGGSFNSIRTPSLMEIIIGSEDKQLDYDALEVYFMIGRDWEGIMSEKTILVRRMSLNFNDCECQVINFTDISAQKSLIHEKSRSKMLSVLNTSVHHEMLGPLKTNVSLAYRLV